MKTPRCSRLGEVEVARDGRLSSAAFLAFERHALSCQDCAHERALLADLARGLRASAVAQDELALRRTRQATLDRAASLLRPHAETRFKSRGWSFFAAGAVAATLAVTATDLRLRGARSEPGPVIETTPVGDAKWTRRHARNLERIDLSDGTLSVRVRRSPNDPRVVVRVPEGEIEDAGTVFKVSVHAGRTVEIAVTQGAVVFRRRGQSDLRLSAGQVWIPIDEARRAGEPLPAASARPALIPPAPARARVFRSPHPAHQAPAVTQVRDNAAPAEPIAARGFDAAEEDAAYLHILALLRESRRDEARLAAAGYLSKFPAGFRRVEVDRIAWPARAR